MHSCVPTPRKSAHRLWRFWDIEDLDDIFQNAPKVSADKEDDEESAGAQHTAPFRVAAKCWWSAKAFSWSKASMASIVQPCRH